MFKTKSLQTVKGITINWEESLEVCVLCVFSQPAHFFLWSQFPLCYVILICKHKHKWIQMHAKARSIILHHTRNNGTCSAWNVKLFESDQKRRHQLNLYLDDHVTLTGMMSPKIDMRYVTPTLRTPKKTAVDLKSG